jgi:hypothetical protein
LTGNPAELRQAERTYRRERLRFEDAPRTYVLAGHVELLDGETLALEETFELQREHVRERRRRRARRRARPSSRGERSRAAERGATDMASDQAAAIATHDAGAAAPVLERPGRRSVREAEGAQQLALVGTT